MAATPRPWGWGRRDGGAGRGGRRLRVRLADLQLRPFRLEWRPDRPPAAYTPNEIRDRMRWEAALGSLPPLDPAALDFLQRLWKYRHHQDTVNFEPRDVLAEFPVVKVGGAASGDGGGGAGGGAWGGAGWGGGLLLGAALLALLLLLRAADSCLRTAFFKVTSRRRESEEWSTPSVAATNLSVRLPGEAGAAAGAGAGPPPPYCEAVDAPKPAEDPPPPYSACYVTYSAPPGEAARARAVLPRRPAPPRPHSGRENISNTDAEINPSAVEHSSEHRAVPPADGSETAICDEAASATRTAIDPRRSPLTAGADVNGQRKRILVV